MWNMQLNSTSDSRVSLASAGLSVEKVKVKHVNGLRTEGIYNIYIYIYIAKLVCWKRSRVETLSRRRTSAFTLSMQQTRAYLLIF